MKLGIQLYGCRKEFRADPEGFLNRMKAAGYTIIEPCILLDRPEESKLGEWLSGELWTLENAGGYAAMIRQREMQIISAHIFCSDVKKHFSEMKALIKELGLKALVFNLPPLKEGELDGYVQGLKQLAEELREAGCELWLHNTERNLAGEKGTSLLEQVLEQTKDTRGIYTQIDSGWAMRDGRTPEDLIAIPDIRIHSLHIKEVAENYQEKEGDECFAVLGEGITNLPLLLQNAKDLSWIIDQDSSNGDFLADLEASARAVKEAEAANNARRGTEWDTSKDSSVLETYDIVTGERTVLQEFPYLIEAPNWSKDGKFLVFNSKGRLHRYFLETGEVVEIPTDFADNCNNDHVLSADGTMVAFSHSKKGIESRVYTVSLEGGVPKEMTEKPFSFLHGWSPDGKTLAYCAFRDFDMGADIYTIPAEGGEEKQLTVARGLNDGPEYDPTGEYIWFNSTRTGLMQAWSMKNDGSEQTQRSFDENWNTWFPHVSPDGKWIAMISYRKGDLAPGEHVPHKDVELRLMVNPLGTATPEEKQALQISDGEEKTVVRLYGGQGTMNVNSWAPDSRRFAFVSYRTEE